jgi:hypothetical protein
MSDIKAKRALFIKLGEKGIWEEESIKKGILKIGFSEVNFSDCKNGNWINVDNDYINRRKKSQIASTGFITQLKYFFEEPEDTLWITFYNNKLWWGKASTKVRILNDGSKVRNILRGWNDEDLKGKKLLVENLRGSLTKVQGFRGTICKVVELDYLLTKINGNISKDIFESYNAYDHLQKKITKLIKSLHWKDFEILVDLIFRQAGWQRVSTVGKSIKFQDLSLLQPVTKEKSLVQIKSESNFKELNSYYKKFQKMKEYDRFFFVVHTTKDEELKQFQNYYNFTVLLIDDISKLVIDSGLTNWVISKM